MGLTLVTVFGQRVPAYWGLPIATPPAVTAELISEMPAANRGSTVDVAIRLHMQPEWHVYWRNPGVGKPTVVSWTLPDGVTAGPLQWPAPKRFETATVAGEPPIVSYGYSDEVLLLSTLTIADTVDGDGLSLSANVDWLACKESCIPGSKTVELHLPLADHVPNIDAANADAFAATRQALPIRDTRWQFAVTVADGKLTIRGTTTADAYRVPAQIHFFPGTGKTINDNAVQNVVRTSDGFELTVAVARDLEGPLEHLDGLLVADGGWPGLDRPALAIDQAVGVSPIAADPPAITPPAASLTPPIQSATTTLPLALVLAFLGGLVLNLMPCVLPVISLKVLGFVQQANDNDGRTWLHGVVFSAGVLVSFWLLAAILVYLRAGGNELGWGFQLQEPAFVVGLALFFFIFALSLFGVFEFGAAATSLGARASSSHGLWSSAYSGVLATIVATPCTGPFMATALGFTITQPGAIVFLVFTSLGAGMAFPYLLLAFFPQWLRLMPKPGGWMESFKQFMGFPLLAVVVWLLWVLGSSVGNDRLARVLMALVVIGIALWLLGRWATPVRSAPVRAGARIVCLTLLVSGTVLAYSSPSSSHAEWEVFSPQRVQALRATNKPVFVDFTADWCLSCKANERIAFTPSVLAAYRERGVVLLKADWTQGDETITRALAEHGRNGVPLYLLYPPGSEHPILLPQLLTPGIMLNALNAW